MTQARAIQTIREHGFRAWAGYGDTVNVMEWVSKAGKTWQRLAVINPATPRAIMFWLGY